MAIDGAPRRRAPRAERTGNMPAQLPPKERDELIILRRSEYVSFRKIAAELGLSRQRVMTCYNEMMAKQLGQSVAAHRAELVEEIDLVRRTALKVLDGKTPVVSSRGEVVLVDEAGVRVELADPRPLIDAGRLLLEANARMSKLIGADAPAKVEQSGSVQISINGVNVEDIV